MKTPPATKMLAVNCAICSRPLVDSKSVDAGMGPECRTLLVRFFPDAAAHGPKGPFRIAVGATPAAAHSEAA